MTGSDFSVFADRDGRASGSKINGQRNCGKDSGELRHLCFVVRGFGRCRFTNEAAKAPPT